ncbi:hypothetical protein NDA18_005124 [Ustilago nuda]|nr:hypothetical protein NDA18_005124 [Ustilago nuda]
MDALASPASPQAASSCAMSYADSPVRPSQLTTQAGQASRNSTADASQPNDAQSQQGLWSSILNSVKSSKAISTKNLVLLGEPKSGKSSLLSALASTSPTGLVSGRCNSHSAISAASALAARPDDKAASRSKPSSAAAAANDLGLAYAYFDFGDEKDRDEIVARVGAYTLHSSQPAYTSLLPFAFPEPNLSSTEQDTAAAMAALASTTVSSSNTTAAASTSPADQSSLLSLKPSIDSLKDSIIIILLDWEQPWSFLEQLRNWLNILRELIDNAAHGALSSRQHRDAEWSRTRVALDEIKDSLESYIRAYVEPAAQKTPSTETSSTTAAATGQPANSSAQPSTIDADALPTPITTVSISLDSSEANPLSEGTLTDNLGIPIVVVCTKADAITRLERDKGFKEEQFDYIQQVLRTICMKYGAALFYTSSLRSQSIDILRSYLLHRLFTPSAQQSRSQSQSGGGGISAAAGGTTVFNFPYRASTTDRDTLLVPAGWDSWGKIKALREPFDAQSMAKGWENDCHLDQQRRVRKLARTQEVEDELEKELNSEVADGNEVQSAMKLYEDIVSDWEATPNGKDTIAKVRIPDEQAFLGQHYATLQKDPDPRCKFSKRAVVGPMTGGSAGLPSVEKYMAKDGTLGTPTRERERGEREREGEEW